MAALWRDGVPADETLKGSADIQWLAYLGNSFGVVNDMSIVHFTKNTVLQLSIVTLSTVIPLTKTMISLEDLLMQLLKAVF